MEKITATPKPTVMNKVKKKIKRFIKQTDSFVKTANSFVSTPKTISLDLPLQ
jgi:hypothetical protein